MFALYDTFNHRVISRHHTVIAVVRASERLSRQMTKSGCGGYLPTTICRIVGGDTSQLKPNDADDDADVLEYFCQQKHQHQYSPLSEIN